MKKQVSQENTIAFFKKHKLIDGCKILLAHDGGLVNAQIIHVAIAAGLFECKFAYDDKGKLIGTELTHKGSRKKIYCPMKPKGIVVRRVK